MTSSGGRLQTKTNDGAGFSCRGMNAVNVERVRAERAAVFDAHALADCRAAHHHGVRLKRGKSEVRRTFDGAAAVDLAFEKLLYGGPAHVAPLLDGPRLAFGEQRRHVLRLRHLDGERRVRGQCREHGNVESGTAVA